MHEVMGTLWVVYTPYPSVKLENDKEIKINMAGDGRFHSQSHNEQISLSVRRVWNESMLIWT